MAGISPGTEGIREVCGVPAPAGSEKPLETVACPPRDIPTLLKQGDNETTTPLVLIRRTTALVRYLRE